MLAILPTSAVVFTLLSCAIFSVFALEMYAIFDYGGCGATNCMRAQAIESCALHLANVSWVPNATWWAVNDTSVLPRLAAASAESSPL